MEFLKPRGCRKMVGHCLRMAGIDRPSSYLAQIGHFMLHSFNLDPHTILLKLSREQSEGTCDTRELRMLTLIVISLLALFANADHTGTEAPLVDVDFQKYPAELAFRKYIPHLIINSPSRRGVMTLTNFVVYGMDKMEFPAKYDPVNRIIHAEMIIPEFRIAANYSANLHYYKNDTILVGDGRLDMTFKDFEIRNMKFPVKYIPRVRKYQLAYPTFDSKLKSAGGEITGLRRVKDGSLVSLEEICELNGGLKRPGFIEMWRSLLNNNMKRGYAVGLGNGLLRGLFNLNDS